MIDQAEQDRVVQIARDYFLQELGSEEKADEAMAKLSALIQEDGAKLIHLDGVVFLVIVRGQGVVEFHTMAEQTTPKELAEKFVKLIDYLKNIGTKVAYSYAKEKIFNRIAKITGLPWIKKNAEVNGENVTVYIVEL